MQADRKRLKQGGHWKVEAVGNRIADPGRHDGILGKAAVPPVVAAGDPQHLPVATEVFPAITALLAAPAEDRRVNRHSPTHRQIGHALSHRIDSAGGFMAHDQRWNPPAAFSGVAVDITAADAAGGHPQADFPRARFRDRERSERELARFCEKKCIHGAVSEKWFI